ncbi:DUF547 domain-containing protein [Glaciecola sp. MH2013]|uniref:DUF547 domain-containing protein n=1 Tax=Glaciecola sp. MH2013 TaxID=2785524 RepID=UPI00189DDE96|nr:DUF547 domain-containing protein [Glaciecola sp. MH2013]MBF7074772.1 DUF547 domain-containing protein [Glaciecola sp. MH2013]
MYNQFTRRAIFFVLLLFWGNSFAQNTFTDTSTDSYAKFAEFSEDASLEMDFSIVDQLLHAGVMNMGPSTRAYAELSRPPTGTRLKQTIDGATENEANRFFYENLAKEQHKILKLRKELEAIPAATPLKLYTKEAQLAYWLNLYNVSLINELAVIYPLNNLRPVLTGDTSILDKKILLVDNLALSLNDIHYHILPVLYPENPLYIYGLHQGIKGSPNIRTKAYKAKSVIRDLKENAREFVNSNRGTQFNGGKKRVRISSFYKRNKHVFPDFDNSFKSHLLEFANGSISGLIENAETFKANINNWRINDFYGSMRRRDVGLYVSSGDGSRFASGLQISPEQRAQLANLMRVRAINFGGGSVTVTDLDPGRDREADVKPETKATKGDDNGN